MILSLSGVYLVFPTTFGDGRRGAAPAREHPRPPRGRCGHHCQHPEPERTDGRMTPRSSLWRPCPAPGSIRCSCLRARTAPSWSPSCRITPARARRRFRPLSDPARKCRRSSIPGRTRMGTPGPGLDEGAPFRVGARSRLEGSCFPFRVPAAAVRHHRLAHVADPTSPEARRSGGLGGACE